MSELGLAVVGSASGVAFINTLKDAVGWYLAPRQAIRMAEAQAKAEFIRAKSEVVIADLKVDDLAQRAEFRCAVEQVVHQLNLENIIAKAIPTYMRMRHHRK